MLSTKDELLKAAMALSESDRLILANRLLDTLAEDMPGLSLDDPALAAELDRRSGQWEGSISWDELRQQLESS